MKEWRYPFGRPPEAVFLILDGDSDARKRKSLFEWLEVVLPGLNWRSHLFLVDGGHGGEEEAAREMVRIAGMIARVLKSGGAPAVLRRVKRETAQLAGSFCL